MDGRERYPDPLPIKIMIPYGYVKRGSGNIHPHNECGICGEARFSAKKARQMARQEISKERFEMLSMTESDWDKLAEMFEAGPYGVDPNERRKPEHDIRGSGDKDRTD
jgi:hypothetical protein